MTCVLLANIVLLPVLGGLFWLMGRKNWKKWLLVIPSIALMDLDHFILTNVPGFGAHPAPGQKILHVTHTIEFVVLEIVILLWVFFKLDPRRGRNLKAWFFPIYSDYTKPFQYYLAWTVRILASGVVAHWLLDLVIYFYFDKWNYLYISLIQYFLHPT
jgi:hypothetical protein